MGNSVYNMDSVFCGSAADDAEFDAIFDQEDSLIDTVNGVDESGDPLTGVDFPDLHQTDDESDVDDVRDYDADDDDFGAPNPEGTSGYQWGSDKTTQFSSYESYLDADDNESYLESDDLDDEMSDSDKDLVDSLEESDEEDDDLDMIDRIPSSGTKYTYDPSDEDIIDAAINGN